MRRTLFAIIVAGALAGSAFAQAPAPVAQKSAKASALEDITGNWVSIVSEDYRWRMVTPLKGDTASVPLNAEGRKISNAWDPAKDEAAGLQCKSYGAPAIMRVPGRLRISWVDDNTLKIEADAGTQTRVFHFGGQPPAGAAPSWQGYSSAQWEPGPGRGARGGLGVTVEGNDTRSLQVSTTQLRPGYLRKNGLPYSDKTTVQEFYDAFKEPDGEEWFTVTTIVTDPVYLAIPFVTTTDFRKESDGSKFSPSACTAR